MTASSWGSQAVVSVLKRSSCAAARSRPTTAIRRAAYSTPSTSESSTSPNILPVTTGSEASSPLDPNLAAPSRPAHHLYPQYEKDLHRLEAGILLSRPPILTQEPHPFESAFYLYQKRLEERLATPFAQQFFFRRGQPAGIDFKIKWLERRRTMQREIGRVNRGGPFEWDDELLIEEGSKLADPDSIRERLYLEAESRVSEDGERLSFEDRLRIERPLGRETDGDRTGDVTRLDRKLDRTLYLVVRKEGTGFWQFPKTVVQPDEVLHETAQRALYEAVGVNMNTWFIGRHPIAYEQWKPVYKDAAEGKEDKVLKTRGRNIFYLRARIMAGQADLTNNQLGLDAFKWLTREEVKEHVHATTFASVELTMPAV